MSIRTPDAKKLECRRCTYLQHRFLTQPGQVIFILLARLDCLHLELILLRAIASLRDLVHSDERRIMVILK